MAFVARSLQILPHIVDSPCFYHILGVSTVFPSRRCYPQLSWLCCSWFFTVAVVSAVADVVGVVIVAVVTSVVPVAVVVAVVVVAVVRVLSLLKTPRVGSPDF